MTDSRKKRMSILDSLSEARAPSQTTPPSPSGTPAMMSNNRALRSARDAVDSHHVWDLDPNMIDDTRLADRIDTNDIDDLRDAIEANGQTVPILVRRHPAEPDRYLLVYGRRRLQAIRHSDKVEKVRALVATLDDDTAVRAQISENMARRDLSYIEKALFAHELVENGFGNQSEVAEVLTVTKSSISMGLSIVGIIGPELVRVIGSAHGIGRPRWEALATAVEHSGTDPKRLVTLAEDVHVQADLDLVRKDIRSDPAEVSIRVFEAVAAAVGPAPAPAQAKKPRRKSAPRRNLMIAGETGGTVRRTAKGLALEIDGGPFADWIEAEADDLVKELHDRWLQRAED